MQSYMLAMVAGLGALYALILAAAPVREFFEIELLARASGSSPCSRPRSA